MRLDKLDLNLFVVFDALYREGSVTGVARQLNLTQPAISNALSRLRDAFDDPLFVRTSEGMAPTPVADAVVADVRRALGLLGDAVAVNARFEPASTEKVFRVAMNDMGEALLLPRLQQLLARRAPRARLRCSYQSRTEHVQALKAGSLDLMLDVSEVNARELEQQALSSFQYVLAMGRRHPLARQAQVTLDEYLAADHVHVSSRRRGRGHADIALHALGCQRAVRLRVHSYYAAAQAVQNGELLWTAPEAIARLTGAELRSLPFDIPQLHWNLYWHRGADQDPANRWLRDLFAEVSTCLSPNSG